MAKKNEEIKSYSEEVQKYYLKFILSSEESFVRCQTIIKPEYFTDRLRPAIKFILTYSIENKVLPTFELVNAKTGLELDRIEGLTPNHTTEFIKTIELFCRHKSMEILILDGVDLVERGYYAEIERRSKENMMISLNKNLGVDYFADPLQRLKDMQDRSGKLSTGWKTVDDVLYGGVSKGELTIFAGPPSSGKSLFLQNLALNWVQIGLNVIYISLEMSENGINLRFDAMIAETPTKMIFKEVENIALKISMARMNGKTKWGKLQVKKLPESGTNANTIKAYLKEYEIQTGIKPDALIVDYLDLLYPLDSRVDLNQVFMKDKYTSEELRSLAFEMDIYLATASQLGRCVSTDTEVVEKTKGIIKISDINIGDEVLTNNGYSPVSFVYPVIKQKAYKIKTKSGKEIICSVNHNFPTSDGLLSISTGLKPGMILKKQE